MTFRLLGRSQRSIADFAVFGANSAHFIGDPYCRELVDEHGPDVVAHTYRLLMPQQQEFGSWFDVDDISDTLIAVIAEAGRHYLPWVAQATSIPDVSERSQPTDNRPYAVN